MSERPASRARVTHKCRGSCKVQRRTPADRSTRVYSSESLDRAQQRRQLRRVSVRRRALPALAPRDEEQTGGDYETADRQER